jgi:hypothetical protein
VLPVFRCADADIEAILQKGERETADLNDKMNKFTESAKQFTMDGGLSLYDFKEDVSGVDPEWGLMLVSTVIDPGAACVSRTDGSYGWASALLWCYYSRLTRCLSNP